MIVTGVVCCDPKQLPTALADAPRPLPPPNPMTLGQRTWQALPTALEIPSVLIPTGTQNGRIWAAPYEPAVTTSAATLWRKAQSIAYGAIFPYPGRWYVYYDNASANLDVVIQATGCTVPLEGYSSPTHTVVTATTTTGALLAANVLRKYALLANIGSVTVFVKKGVAAVANQGIPIEPGGSYEIFGDNLWRGALNVITGSGTADVTVEEGV